MSIVRNITADVASPLPFTVKGDFIMYISGGFGSGTAQLERRNLDLTWTDIIGATYTSPATDEVTSGRTEVYRITVSGSTTPTIRIEVPGATDFNE